MWKQLAIKELHESLAVMAVAVLVMIWVVGRYMGVNFLPLGEIQSGYILPFVSDGFNSWLLGVMGAVAVALGLKQSAWESGTSTYAFLLHRPVSRRSVFSVKVVVGSLLLIGLLSASILVYAWWAATPGNHLGPFYWSMTFDTWKLALVLPLIYLGALVSGIRPANWLGTRLVPLAAAGLWTMVVGIAPVWWMQLPLLVIGYACLVAALVHYFETRDY